MSEFKDQFYRRLKEYGGMSKVLEKVAEGIPIRKIAAELLVSRAWLNNLLSRNTPRNEKLFKAYQAAKKEAAGAIVEEGMQILDDAPLDQAAVQKAKSQAEYRKWLAGMWDRERYGEQTKGSAITLNIGELHIKALKDFKVPRPVELDVASEVISITSGEK